jgi:hypothetical protein
MLHNKDSGTIKILLLSSCLREIDFKTNIFLLDEP